MSWVVELEVAIVRFPGFSIFVMWAINAVLLLEFIGRASGRLRKSNWRRFLAGDVFFDGWNIRATFMC